MAAAQRSLDAKVVILDEDDAVLQFRGGDPARADAGTWWFMPGGGLEPGESFEEAARREVLEETGFEIGDVSEIVPACSGWTAHITTALEQLSTRT